MKNLFTDNRSPLYPITLLLVILLLVGYVAYTEPWVKQEPEKKEECGLMIWHVANKDMVSLCCYTPAQSEEDPSVLECKLMTVQPRGTSSTAPEKKVPTYKIKWDKPVAGSEPTTS